MRFLTLMKCSPVDLGRKDATRLLSDNTLSLIGSSADKPGLLKVDISFGKSLGRLSPGFSRRKSQGLPTAFSGSAASTTTKNGLSGTSFPDFIR